MPKIFDIKNTSQVRSVFNVIYNEPGQVIEINELVNQLGINRNTVSYILNWLEQSFLIRKLYNFSRNSRKIERKIETNFGAVFESFIVINLNAQYFWRDSFKNELDIVIEKIKGNKKDIKGIEIKQGLIKSLKTFVRKFKLKNKDGFIISFDTKEKRNDIKIIPFYEYFLK